MAPTVSKVTQKSFYDLSKKELKTRVEGKLSDTDVKARAATLRCCALARRALARPRRPPPPPGGGGGVDNCVLQHVAVAGEQVPAA
jgi:hypothetical protein